MPDGLFNNMKQDEIVNLIVLPDVAQCQQRCRCQRRALKK